MGAAAGGMVMFSEVNAVDKQKGNRYHSKAPIQASALNLLNKGSRK